ncbi:epimerase, partial [Pseudomonadota bacterium]|nr:epimerase [Pseudomonadota bacterium]
IGQVINLGNPVESSMKEALEIILEESQSTLIPTAVDTDARYGDLYEDINRRVPSVDKAKELLGWEPTTSLKDGISKTMQWAKNNPWYLE